MTERNEKLFKIACESLKANYGRDLTEEEIELVRKQYDNEKAEEIDFRPGETDLTGLKQEQINQLLIRQLSDLNAYAKFINTTLNDVYYALAYVIKQNGEKEPFKAIEEFSSDEYDKFKKGE